MKKIAISIFMILSFSLNADQFQMTGKLIKAKISYQNLNRISVKGDKIDTIVGIDTAFHFEKNEKTGEVFLKPTEDNGHTPISISITTASGKTQDLLLEVVNGDAKSIELISEPSAEEGLPTQFYSSEYFSDSEDSIGGNDYEESIAAIMKKFINSSSHAKVDLKTINNRSYSHIFARFQSAYRIDGFLCLKFKVTTDKENVSSILEEKMFSQKGDIALSLSTLHLDKNQSATLYVLRPWQ